MGQLSQENERFKLLLGEILDEVDLLKQEVKNLKKQNTNLVSKIEDLRNKQTDIFSAISEAERLALRQHVQGLILKIDNHLTSTA